MTPPPSTIARLQRLTLTVRDLDRAIAFYAGALDFRPGAATADGVLLTLGAQEIELVGRPDAAPYPSPRSANDPWFQHFAIAVADMDAAYARLSHHGAEPISQGGPQLLPPSTGSVIAYKFRDPDGHPLELSHAPGSDWSAVAAPKPGSPFLGIDHTALAVSDLDASIAFYTGLGFRIGVRSLNQGPEQARLDGLEGACVDIVTLTTPDAGPHIELLHYRTPASAAPRMAAPGGVAATLTVLALAEGAAGEEAGSVLPDPDGHLLRLAARIRREDC